MPGNRSHLSRLLPDVNPCNTKLEKLRPVLILSNKIEKKNVLHFKFVAFRLLAEQRHIGLFKQHFHFTND